MTKRVEKEWKVTGWPLLILVCLPWWVGMYVIVRATIEAL